MNYSIKTANIDCLYEYGLRITQCGLLTAFGCVKSVPHIYDNYVLTFVTKGKGTYTIDGVLNHVKTGEAFLTAPNVMTSWTTENQEPMQSIFVVVSGPDLLKILKDAGIGIESKVFKYCNEDDENKINNLFSMYNSSISDNISAHELLAYFYLIMSEVSMHNKSTAKDSSTTQSVYFKKAITFINNNYSSNINIIDIANFLNIDRTYLYKIFKNKADISPIQYLNDYRLEKAKQMIECSDFSNTDIAIASGFYDYPHFSRAFMKKYGLTPVKFRKQIQSKTFN